MLTCPKCERNAYYICSKKDCVCHKIPKGEKGLIYRPVIFGVTVSKWIFSVAWKLAFKINQNPYEIGLNELEECPWCGFRASFDFWEDREMKQTFPNGTFGELEKITNQVKEK